MKTTPEVIYSDQNEVLISSITHVLRDLHPNA